MVRKIKNIVCVFLALILMCFTSCQKNTEQEDNDIIIGFALYDQYDTYLQGLQKHFLNEAKLLEEQTHKNITILKKSANRSQNIQNSQVQGFIESGCDVICLNLVDRTDVTLIIDMAEASKIPIIFFNRELVEEDLHRLDNLYYVGADAFLSGELQGEIVADLWKNDTENIDKNNDNILQYVMLEGEPVHQDSVVRTEYSIKTIMRKGINVERLDVGIANWSRSQGKTKMDQWIKDYNNSIEAIISNNDDMALGAIDALKESETPISKWPIIVGIDGTEPALTSLLSGELSATVYNDFIGQSEKLLDLAYALATNGKLPELENDKYIRLPYKKIYKNNAVDYMQKYNQTEYD